MARIVVVGASGRTGLLIVEALTRRGDTVIGTIRNPGHRSQLEKAGAAVEVLDLATAPLGDFAKVFAGADAIVFAAGSAAGETSELDRIGTVKTVRAAKKAGVARYVTVSAMGVSTGLSTRTLNDEMKDYYRQKRSAARYLVASGLDWTSMEPGELTDGPATGTVSASLDRVDRGAISRADVAAATVVALDTAKTIRKAIQLWSGTTPVAEAIRAAVA